MPDPVQSVVSHRLPDSTRLRSADGVFDALTPLFRRTLAHGFLDPRPCRLVLTIGEQRPRQRVQDLPAPGRATLADADIDGPECRHGQLQPTPLFAKHGPVFGVVRCDPAVGLVVQLAGSPDRIDLVGGRAMGSCDAVFQRRMPLLGDGELAGQPFRLRCGMPGLGRAQQFECCLQALPRLPNGLGACEPGVDVRDGVRLRGVQPAGPVQQLAGRRVGAVVSGVAASG